MYDTLNSSFLYCVGGLKIVNNELKNTDDVFMGLKNIRVATFGDSGIMNPGDWIPILPSKLPSDAFKKDEQSGKGISPGVCKDMVLSLHIEIAFARIGSFANPQSKIMGVNYKFGSAQDVTFQCIGFGACKNPSKTQRIEVSSSVQFTDVTLPASDYYAEYPVIEAKLPYDFFYPFLTSTKSSGNNRHRIHGGIIFLLILSYLYFVAF